MNLEAAVDVSAAPVGLLWWNISGMSEVGWAGMMNEGPALGSGSLRVCKQGALNPDLRGNICSAGFLLNIKQRGENERDGGLEPRTVHLAVAC